MLGELGVVPASRASILEDMFNSVVLKDIVARHNVRDTDLLARLITYVMSEFGRVFSANSISNYLKTERRSFSNDTLMNYLRICQDAYLFATVPFHDVVEKRMLNINEKCYVVDHGLRNAIVGRDAQDIERVLENIVYYELRRRGETDPGRSILSPPEAVTSIILKCATCWATKKRAPASSGRSAALPTTTPSTSCPPINWRSGSKEPSSRQNERRFHSPP